MTIPRTGLLLILAVPAVGTPAEAPVRLEASAEPASASIRPVSEGRKLVELPALEYRIAIDARCHDSDRPESVSVSAADTRITLRGEDLDDASDIVVALEIPANQVSPLPVNEFCTSDEWAGRDLLIPDAVTAHLSLRCRSDDGESIAYATRQLAVELTCEDPNQAESESLILR